jgi:putative Mg2+ transporter-C (MgtC) family protein
MVMPVGWNQQLIDIGKLLLAYLLALPVGWYREKEAHTIGVRTFPLVAMASCGYVLLGMPEYTHTPEAQSRIIQGLITGIGFIGGAAIFRGRGSVRGTATAASIWNTGVVGAAVAEDRWLLAITLALLNLFALRALLPIKQKLDRSEDPPKEM